MGRARPLGRAATRNIRLTFSDHHGEGELSKADALLAMFFFSIALILRVLLAYHFRIDSDEPQPLYVVCAWTRGLLPYRDVFDNHMPVFQALSAPLFYILGVRADIVLPMRLAMIPLFAATIWCVWKISASIFSPRIALWTALLAAFIPPFFLTSVEYRHDDLWTAVWLMVLTVLVTGRATVGRAFIAGLLLGLTFAVSMKTSLMALSLGLACIGAVVAQRFAGCRIEAKRLILSAVAALLGIVTIPGIIVLFFVIHGVGRQMFSCVISHNILPRVTDRLWLMKSATRWLALLPIEFFGVWMIWRWRETIALRSRLTLIFLVAAFYYSTFLSLWPLREPQTRLPFYPVMAIILAPSLLWFADSLLKRTRVFSFILPALIVAAEIALIARGGSPFANKTTGKIGLIANVLKLTDESDYVMDSKGETIYRRRPIYYMLDRITRRRMQRHMIRVAFITDNYLPIAFRLRVLGKTVRSGDEQWESTRFEVVVPGRYTVVCESGKIAGLLDGTEFDGPRELTAGSHTFQQTAGVGRTMLIWARAIERGYSPFAAIEPDKMTQQD
ncbi:MAG: hypothetical protein DME50_15140 [Verrucomicrobia bacterium]|nr:MAG: hypothetical protein DME50_15140 [Verrucomicrobiota bacterium]